jgi:hypothetical protein
MLMGGDQPFALKLDNPCHAKAHLKSYFIQPSDKIMRILITGGTGLIGKQLCAALLGEGHELTVLSRKPESVAMKCGSAVKAIGSLKEWPQDKGFDAVINLAGEPIIDWPWSASRKERLWASRIGLTRQLVSHMAQQSGHAPSVLLSGSAIGYYGNTGDACLGEDAPNAVDFGAQLCAAWEQAALKAVTLNTRVCVLRTGLVITPSGGLLGKMLLPFKWGFGARIGHGAQWMSWIHMDDYVAIVIRLLNDPSAAGAYNMTAPNPATNQAFTKALANALHRPALWVAPAWFIKLALGQRAYMLLGGQRVMPTKVTALNYQFICSTLEDAMIRP